MDTIETLPVLSRLAYIIDGLCKAVLARTTLPLNDRRSETVLPLPFVLAVTRRLRRAEALIVSLAARFRAGLLKPPARRAPPAKPRARPTKPTLVLPRHFAWLCPLVPCDAAIRGNHLRLLLEEPEMQAIIAASPHAVRILRPIYRMLAIETPILIPAIPAPAPEPSPPAPTPPVHAAPPQCTPQNPPCVQSPWPLPPSAGPPA